MQSRETFGTEGTDDVPWRALEGDRSTRPAAMREYAAVDGRAAVFDRMFDDVAAEDAELLERLAR